MLHYRTYSLRYMQNGKVVADTMELIIVESAQILHESINSEIASSLKYMKNETLYNLSIESPLLRDADIMDEKSIVGTWRGTRSICLINVDASMRKREELKEWVTGRVMEGEELLDLAEEKLEMVKTLQREGQALRTLGDNVL